MATSVKLLTVKEAAKMSGLAEWRVYEIIKRAGWSTGEPVRTGDSDTGIRVARLAGAEHGARGKVTVRCGREVG